MAENNLKVRISRYRIFRMTARVRRECVSCVVWVLMLRLPSFDVGHTGRSDSRALLLSLRRGFPKRNDGVRGDTRWENVEKKILEKCIVI